MAERRKLGQCLGHPRAVHVCEGGDRLFPASPLDIHTYPPPPLSLSRLNASTSARFRTTRRVGREGRSVCSPRSPRKDDRRRRSVPLICDTNFDPRSRCLPRDRLSYRAPLSLSLAPMTYAPQVPPRSAPNIARSSDYVFVRGDRVVRSLLSLVILLLIVVRTVVPLQ